MQLHWMEGAVNTYETASPSAEQHFWAQMRMRWTWADGNEWRAMSGRWTPAMASNGRDGAHSGCRREARIARLTTGGEGTVAAQTTRAVEQTADWALGCADCNRYSDSSATERSRQSSCWPHSNWSLAQVESESYASSSGHQSQLRLEPRLQTLDTLQTPQTRAPNQSTTGRTCSHSHSKTRTVAKAVDECGTVFEVALQSPTQPSVCLWAPQKQVTARVLNYGINYGIDSFSTPLMQSLQWLLRYCRCSDWVRLWDWFWHCSAVALTMRWSAWRMTVWSVPTLKGYIFTINEQIKSLRTRSALRRHQPRRQHLRAQTLPLRAICIDWQPIRPIMSLTILIAI